MTIKGLSAFLKKLVPDYIQLKPLSDFSGHYVAVDILQHFYSMTATAHKRVDKNRNILFDDADPIQTIPLVVKRLLGFIELLLSHDIIPVLVFDGETPTLKNEAKTRRIETKKKDKKKAEELRQELKRLDEDDERYKELKSKLRSLEDRLFDTGDNISIIKTILRQTGLPVLEATGEADRLCSMLAIDGYVAAAWSNDSDLLAHGCPLVIKNMYQPSKSYHSVPEDIKSRAYVETISLPHVLESLGLDHPTFQDLCIVGGCDYNTNIRGIAILTAYRKLHASDTDIMEILKDKDTSCINYEECKALFAYTPSTALIRGGKVTKKELKALIEPYPQEDLETLETTLSDYGIGLTSRQAQLLKSMTPKRGWKCTRPP